MIGDGDHLAEIVRTEAIGDVLVVAVRGEIDISNAEQIGGKLKALVERQVGAIIVDLTDVTFVDAAGTRALVAATQSQASRRCVVTKPESIAQRVADITHSNEILSYRESLSEALALVNAR